MASTIKNISVLLIFFLALYSCGGSSSDENISEYSKNNERFSQAIKNIFNPQETGGNVYTDDPEAMDWQNEKNAVVMQNDNATATFINNIRNDGKLYLISARHSNEEIWWRNREDYDANRITHEPLLVGGECLRKFTIQHERNNIRYDIFAMVTARAISNVNNRDLVLFEITDPTSIPLEIRDKIYLLGWDARSDAFNKSPSENSEGVVMGHGLSNDNYKKFSQYKFVEKEIDKNSNSEREWFSAATIKTASGFQDIIPGHSNSLLISSATRRAVAMVAYTYGGHYFGGDTFNSIYNDDNFRKYLDPDNTGVRTVRGAYYSKTDLPNSLPSGNFSIASKLPRTDSSTKLCLDIRNGSIEDKAELISWNCHSGANQKWQLGLRKGATDFYQICSVNSDKCLAYSRATNRIFQLSSGATACDRLDVCYWKIDGMNRLINYSASDNLQCISVIPYGNSIHENCSSISLNQQFELLQDMSDIKSDPAPKKYSIKNLDSNKCLDINSSSKATYTEVIAWNCHSGLNQQWNLFNKVSSLTGIGNTAQLCSVDSAKCLSTFGLSEANAACAENSDYCYLVDSYAPSIIRQISSPSIDKSTDPKFNWGIDSLGRIKNSMSNKCLTVDDFHVTEAICSATSAAQRWRIEEVSE